MKDLKRSQKMRRVSETLANRIRSEYWASRFTKYKHLAESYGVSVSTVHRICTETGVYEGVRK